MVATEGIVAAIAAVAPGVVVEEVDVPGPPTSVSLRAAGWAEVAAMAAVLAPVADVEGVGRSGTGHSEDVRPGATRTVQVTSPEGATATASLGADGVAVTVRCGSVLDAVVLRSYCIGAAHMALGWVRTEGLAVADSGEVLDLTIRSFGIVRPAEMPPVEVAIIDDDSEPVNGSDAVFAAVAAAAWLADDLAPVWPTRARSGS